MRTPGTSSISVNGTRDPFFREATMTGATRTLEASGHLIDSGLMAAIMDAVKAYASVGEITAVLTEAFGRYQEPMRF